MQPEGVNTKGTQSDARCSRWWAAPDFLACLGIIVISLAVLWPVLAGQVLIPTEGLFFVDPVFAQYRTPDISPWQNTLLVADLVGMIYPWREFTNASFAAGRIPLWNPYSACGMPFLANDQAAVLNPTNLVLNWLFSAAIAQTLFGIVTILLASLSTYGLVRALGGTPIGAFLSGLTYGFSGFIFIWLGYPLAATAALLPLLLWATKRFANRPSGAGAAVIGAIIGWQFLSGHLSTSVQMLAFWIVFSGYEILRHRSSSVAGWGPRYVSLLCLALVLGCGLGAAQLLPLGEYYRVSTISATGRSRWSGASTVESIKRSISGDLGFLRTIALGETALLFNPEAHGHPAFNDYRQYPDYGNYAERTSYPGSLALAVMIASLFRWPSPGYRRFFVAAGWLVFAALIHLPIANTLTYLPVLRLAAPQRMRFIFSLCAAVSLGLAASNWAGNAAENRRTRNYLLWALAGVSLASCIIAIRAFVFLSPHLIKLPIGLHMLRIFKILCPSLVTVALTVVVLLWRCGRVSSRIVQWSLPALMVLDLVVFGLKWHAFSKPQYVLPMLPKIKTMLAAAGTGRINGSAVMFRPNLSVAYKCYDSRAYDPISVSRFVSLVEATYGVHPGSESLISLGSEEPSRLLECLTSTRVRWQKEEQSRVEPVSISDSLPRAYITGRIASCSRHSALDTVLAIGNPWKYTVIEGGAPVESSHESITPAEIIEYSPHRVIMRTNINKPGWLVLTDTFFPGWSAFVNGQVTPIIPANYAFRSVSIPAGESRITFNYEPSSYLVGLFVSCLALCCTVGLVMGQIKGGVSRRRPPR